MHRNRVLNGVCVVSSLNGGAKRPESFGAHVHRWRFEHTLVGYAEFVGFTVHQTLWTYMDIIRPSPGPSKRPSLRSNEVTNRP